MVQTTSNDLLHGCKVIRTYHRFNLKLAIIAVFCFAILKNHHGANGSKALCIRNIVCFHTMEHLGQTKSLTNFFHCTFGALFFPFHFLTKLFKDDIGIFVSQFHQLLFFPFDGHGNGDFTASAFCQICFQKGGFFWHQRLL